ncbi:hypothetical protein KIPB_006491 [Kipferlia bialata]|uniref:Xaa-Pro dipeptidyl-peptidase C-terminal domain-containing protein n=1 Tax=Kipferlia bialata TaxID=797122 RepID=A0A9K3CYM7_9EUKA|nr:hypothetical protein KIPB_006491 [Kipferlia bialata]|eukprot:g6491.t1
MRDECVGGSSLPAPVESAPTEDGCGRGVSLYTPPHSATATPSQTKGEGERDGQAKGEPSMCLYHCLLSLSLLCGIALVAGGAILVFGQTLTPTPTPTPFSSEVVGASHYMQYTETDPTLHYRQVPTSGDDDTPHPVILSVTPYNAYSSRFPALSFYPGMGDETHTVAMDVRGRYRSEGDFEWWDTAPVDVPRVMEDIMRQGWADQGIFTYGASADAVGQYMAFTTDRGVAERVPLLGQLMTVGANSIGQWAYQGGSMRHYAVNKWCGINLRETELLDRMYTMAEGQGPGMYGSCRSQTMAEEACETVSWPSVHIAGTFDMFQGNTFKAFDCYRNAGTMASLYSYLVVDYGGHCYSEPSGSMNHASRKGFTLVIGKAIFGAFVQTAIERGITPASRWTASDYAALSVNVQSLARTAMLTLSSDPPPLRDSVVWIHSLPVPDPDTSLNAVSRGWYTCTWPIICTVTRLSLLSTRVVDTVTFRHTPDHLVPTVGGHTFQYTTCGPWEQPIPEQVETLRLTGEAGATLPTYSEVTFPASALTGGDEVDTHIIGQVRATVGVSIAADSGSAADIDLHLTLCEVDSEGGRVMIAQGVQRVGWRGEGEVLEYAMPAYGERVSVEVDLWHAVWHLSPGSTLSLLVAASNYPMYIQYGQDANGEAVFSNSIHPSCSLFSSLTPVTVDITSSWIDIPVVLDVTDSCDVVRLY